METVLPLLCAGKRGPVVDLALPLAEAARVYETRRSPPQVGGMVLLSPE